MRCRVGWSHTQPPGSGRIAPPIRPDLICDRHRRMAQDTAGIIEVQVEAITQLFDTLDPFPFRERDLDKDAEEYIVGWARELPRDRPIEIIIYAPASELQNEHAQELGPALSRYFRYRSEVIGRDLNELFRIGRR